MTPTLFVMTTGMRRMRCDAADALFGGSPRIHAGKERFSAPKDPRLILAASAAARF